MKNSPIIIIGAGRSGTNILRDCICSIKGFETWPCDEINYIWRHGNVNKATDRFSEADVNPKARSYITGAFKRFEKESGAEYIVEKTCANSLKVPFINEIFPKAKYIFLARDGRDVASSAKQRWTAPLELGYIWKKVKYVPVFDIPYYGFRYLINRVQKLFSKEKRLAFWGPIYPGMMDDLRTRSLIEVCGMQWSECVKIANTDLSKIEAGRVHRMTYEDFVRNPILEMKKVMKFIGVESPEEVISNSIRKVSPKSIGNYGKYLTDKEVNELEDIVKPTMETVYQSIK